jgi:GR25 family glycosyltransferase involved in LPS biosynthesis
MIFYWINLDKDVGRRNNIEKLFKDNNYQNVRVQGVEIENKDIACALAHVKAIRQFLESSDELAIICEDDLSLDFKPYWNTNIEGVIQDAPSDWEIIQLSIIVHGNTINDFINANTNYLPYSTNYFSSLCYVINRKGAAKVVNSEHNDIAEYVVYKSAKTYTYRRPLFVYADNVGSNIHPNHLEGHKRSKQVVRKWLEVSSNIRKIDVFKVEIHASHACNFTCESCSHFSNQGHKGFLSVEEADRQMGFWSNRLNPQWFAVIGGEPLLNPNIEKILEVARKHWKGDVEIITNGFLLPNFPNLGSLLERLDIRLVISKHSDTPDFNAKWNEIMQYLARRNMKHNVKDSVSDWTRRYKGWGPNVLPYEDNRPKDSWNICPAKFCLQILEGKLYKCPLIAYLKLQKKRWPEISTKWDRYLEYKPLEPTATDQELYDFVNAKHEYICEMCPAEIQPFQKPSPLITIGELLSKLKTS